jgi:hypothetical protein
MVAGPPQASVGGMLRHTLGEGTRKGEARLLHGRTTHAATDRCSSMPCMRGWAVRVLDLLGLDKLAIELVAGVDAADRPSPGASANEHADPTPRLHGEQLLMTGSWSFAGTGSRCRRTSRHDNTASPDVRGAQQGLPGRWRSTPADHVQNWLCHLIMRHRWRRRRRTGGRRRTGPCQVPRRTADGRRRPGPGPRLSTRRCPRPRTTWSRLRRPRG